MMEEGGAVAGVGGGKEGAGEGVGGFDGCGVEL